MGEQDLGDVGAGRGNVVGGPGGVGRGNVGVVEQDLVVGGAGRGNVVGGSWRSTSLWRCRQG